MIKFKAGDHITVVKGSYIGCDGIIVEYAGNIAGTNRYNVDIFGPNIPNTRDIIAESVLIPYNGFGGKIFEAYNPSIKKEGN